MGPDLSREIDRLPTLPRAKLLALWGELFAKPPLPKLRRDLIIPILAYRMQEKVYGGLKSSTRRRLRSIARDLECNPQAQLEPHHAIKPGTKLIRQWQNHTHEVVAGSNRFEYEGQQYKSLSQIARQITGTRWSGPAFFGLRQLQKKDGNP